MAIKPGETGKIEEQIMTNQSRIAKMCSTDRNMIMFWIALMWVILVAVYMQVSAVAEPAVKMVALAAGVLVGAFSTAALLAVNGHLKRKKDQLYGEDLYHLEKMQQARTTKWNLTTLFDVFFILILCYICLLIPILLRGKVLVGGGDGGGMLYTFTWGSLALCLAAAGVFGYFVLSHSEKELKVLIDNVYGKKEETL